MPSKPTSLSERDAQALMSLLMDGELSPSDAARLHDYLETRPEAIQWMESSQLIADATRTEETTAPPLSPQDIEKALWGDAAVVKGPGPGNLLSFPALFRLAGIAAALVLVASLLWVRLSPSEEFSTERYAASESVVEFVDTGIPDASPIVYTDEASGWTVVWVAEMDPLPDGAG